MTENINVNLFLSNYSEPVCSNALKLRDILYENLPEVQEQIDIPARMIAFSYGPRYAEMICTIIPSQKGLKLGFYKGTDLPDPDNLLKGNGKISRYVEIKKTEDIGSNALITLVKEAFAAYKTRYNK